MAAAASTNTSTYKNVLKQIKSRSFAPVYFLYGEESYFIDKITEQLEEKALEGIERSFNFDVLYGPEVTPNSLIAILRAYPTMAARRVVIIKEAHRIKKDYYDKIAPYLEKPVPTTIAVFIHKDAKPPAGKFASALKQNTVVFESKALYENQITAWIEEYAGEQKVKIEPDAVQVLYQSLGNNLPQLENEINKMLLHLYARENKVIDRNLVHEFVAIDRDFNVFELIKQIGVRNPQQAHLILWHLMRNTRENAPIAILTQLFGYFSKLALCRSHKAVTEDDVAKALGVNRYFAKDYIVGLKNYTSEKIQENLTHILEADLALKGVTNTRMGEPHIMITLLYKLL